MQMNGVGNDDTGVLVLGATNIPWQLDNAIKRRCVFHASDLCAYLIFARFEKRIYIPLPGADARKRVFELNVGNTPCELVQKDYRALGIRSEG